MTLVLLWVAWQVLTTRPTLRQGEPATPPVFAATLIFALSIELVVIPRVSSLYLL